MPVESDFFEEAYELCNHSSPPVSRAADRLYTEMQTRFANDGLSPEAGFNILYFFQSAVRLLFIEFPQLGRLPDGLSNSIHPIVAARVPSRTDQWRGRFAAEIGLLDRYISLVQRESRPKGTRFDVGYATEILSLTFDEQAVSGILSGEPRGDCAEPFGEDDWLSGFNSS